MMGVALGHFRILMTQQALHNVQIHPSLAEARGEGMPQIVEPKIGEAGALSRTPERPVDRPFGNHPSLPGGED